ncbi:O-antigen ligase family protein [Ruegeria arenilitoris]|uniref:O-antigen ligase family protein n=1 Tax=Ruegeria arenilitoris TaxID=1173585 RepID=UPI0014819295|nr:O-antigen ligase family protein [Ruegeria arenilitoris]
MTSLVNSAHTKNTNLEPTAQKYERFLFILLFAGFSSIFLGLDLKTPLLVLKPFDLVCLVCTPILIGGSLLKRRLSFSTGFGLVLFFLTINVALAFPISAKNGIRETIQAVELAMFGYVLVLYAGQLDWIRMARTFILVSILITCFNVYWHVASGFYFGWKRLDEPKLLFSYAVPVIFALMICTKRRARLIDYVVIGLIAGLLVMSGERKAQLAFILNLVLLLSAGYVRLSVLSALALCTLPFVAMLIASDDYLTRQLFSVFNFGQFEDFTLAEMATGKIGITQSNSQRIFSGQLTWDLVRVNPFLGLGTNGYTIFVRENYHWLPQYFLTSIHNEFQRVLVENGMLGLVAYTLPWVRSLSYGVLIYVKNGKRYAAIFFMFWVTFFIQCFFEGSGNEAFLAFLFVALLPELFYQRLSHQFAYSVDPK